MCSVQVLESELDRNKVLMKTSGFNLYTTVSSGALNTYPSPLF